MYGMPYNAPMIELRRTAAFDTWLDGLRDSEARARITHRLQRLAKGNHGDHKRFSGLLELRLSYGSGYRVYCVERGQLLVILLGGGTKATQSWDIKRAIKIAEQL